MYTKQSFLPSTIKASITKHSKSIFTTLPLLAVVFSSVAFAQVDSTTIRYAGGADGGWSGSGASIPGPQDGSCANMGAVNKENQAFNFGFTLPNDATIEAVSAEIFATTNDAPNQPIGVELATGADTDPATGLLGTQQQLIVPQTGADCASATPLSFPADGMGGEEADWGIPVDGWPTVAQVNAVGFGLVFAKLQTSSIKVDSVCLEIFYTTPEGPAVQEDCFADGATLTLVKEVVNDNNGNNPDTDWTLTATGPTPGVTGIEGDVAITAATVDAGTYVLTESNVPGYTQTDLSCDGGVLENGNELTLADGNAVICTFTNNDIAPTVTLIKNPGNDNGGNAGVNDFGLTIGGVGVNSNVATPVDANTPIALNEAGLAGYTFVSITGDAGCPASLGGTVTLDEGASITCTINNTDVAPTVTLIKNPGNDNGGNAGVNDFGLTVGGGAVNSGDQTAVDANTPIALNEAGLAGYTFVSITGDAGCPASLGGTVTLDEGENITCTINNTDVAPTITLIKNPINNNGGMAGVNDFGLTVGGGAVNSGDQTAVDANTPIALNEAGLAGYTFVSITGDAGCPAGLGGTVTLDEGENITCTINNDDDASGLTVVKTITSDNGGTATLDDFNVRVDGVEVAWANANSTTGGSEFITDMAGDYLLAEDAVNGYTNGTWTCGGAPLTNAGAFGGATVTVGLGQSVTCMITNMDDETALVVTKVIESDNGGTATLGDFDVSVDGVEVAWSNAAATDTGTETVKMEAGTYTLSEIDFDGYTEGTWTCSDDGGNVAVDPVSNNFGDAEVVVGLGQTVTCSITNTDDPVSLTLVKQVTNDNGGNDQIADFTLAANGPGDSDIDGPGGAMSTSLDAGTYQLEEFVTPSAYAPSNWSCVVNGGDPVDSGGFDSGSIDLGLGDSAVCTIVNNDVAPTITLNKVVTNNNGGNAGMNDFGLSIGGVVVNSGVTTPVNANADIALTEAGLTGYEFVSMTGDGCPGSLGGTVNLDEGEDIVCTITNDDVAPTLTLIKNVINDDNGQLGPDDFGISVAGSGVDSGQEIEYDANTALAINEDVVDGYSFSGISGDAKCPAVLGGTVTLDEGDDITCTITNNDDEPAVPVPADNIWALLLMVLLMMGSGLYFRHASIRK